MKIESKDVTSFSPFNIFFTFENYAIICIIIRRRGNLLLGLEKVAIVEFWLGRYCWRLQVLIVIECRVVEVSMIVQVRLLKVNVSLLLRFVILVKRLVVRMMIDFDWLSYLWLVLSPAHAALNANHVTGLQWRVTPQTRNEQWQQGQPDPSLCATDFLGSIAATRAWMIDEITFGVAHAVI